MRYRLVIFDFDGTLADSFPWFSRVLNDFADRHGFRRVAADEVDDLRGLPAREILHRLEIPLWQIPRIAADMRSIVRDADDIALFPGAADTLRRLADDGVRIAIVTSNAEDNVRRVLGPSQDLVADFACGASLFGKARKFRRVLRRAGLAGDDALAIGDEHRDVEAARAAGVRCGVVSWGYARLDALAALQPDHVFRRFDEITATPDARAVAGARP